jgi:type II secretory pathway pseudopilin PulG
LSDADTNEKGGSSCLTLLVAVSLLGVGAAIAVPNLQRVHHESAEAFAIGCLKTLATSESVFREGDKENDGNLDYGMLSELSATNLVDGVLGSGTKYGYRFVAAYSFTTSEFLWFAVGQPDPGRKAADEGDQTLFTNQAGEILHARDAGPIPVDPETCEVRSNLVTVLPTGR